MTDSTIMRVADTDDEKTGKGFSVAIASGKGGTGKTFLATNMFYSLLQKEIDATLVDCDAEEPNVAIFFRKELISSETISRKKAMIDVDVCRFCMKCSEYCNFNAIFGIPQAKIIRINEDLCNSCGACLLACYYDAIHEKDVDIGSLNSYQVYGKGTIVEARTISGLHSPVPMIKAALAKPENGKNIIIDSPPGTSCPFIQTVAKASFVILVTEPTPFGLSDLKQSVDTLRQMKKDFGVVVNRAGIGNRDVYKYLEDQKIDLLMEIAFDKDIASKYAEGKLVAESKPDFQNALREMYSRIVKAYGDSSSQW